MIVIGSPIIPAHDGIQWKMIPPAAGMLTGYRNKSGMTVVPSAGHDDWIPEQVRYDGWGSTTVFPAQAGPQWNMIRLRRHDDLLPEQVR